MKTIENLNLDVFLNGTKPIQKFNNRIYMNSKIDAVIQRNQLYKQIQMKKGESLQPVHRRNET